jgi:hypothetical protein
VASGLIRPRPDSNRPKETAATRGRLRLGINPTSFPQARQDIRARLIFQFFFFLSLSLGIPHAGLKLPGFKNPTTEIPTPPSDYIPLRRCCAFGARCGVCLIHSFKDLAYSRSMVETRIAPRHRVLKAAKIAFGGGTIDCTIRDLSITGAALEVSNQGGIPAQFISCAGRWVTSALQCCVAQWISDRRGFRLRPPQLTASLGARSICHTDKNGLEGQARRLFGSSGA